MHSLDRSFVCKKMISSITVVKKDASLTLNGKSYTYDLIKACVQAIAYTLVTRSNSNQPVVLLFDSAHAIDHVIAFIACNHVQRIVLKPDISQGMLTLTHSKIKSNTCPHALIINIDESYGSKDRLVSHQSANLGALTYTNPLEIDQLEILHSIPQLFNNSSIVCLLDPRCGFGLLVILVHLISSKRCHQNLKFIPKLQLAESDNNSLLICSDYELAKFIILPKKNKQFITSILYVTRSVPCTYLDEAASTWIKENNSSMTIERINILDGVVTDPTFSINISVDIHELMYGCIKLSPVLRDDFIEIGSQILSDSGSIDGYLLS